METTTVVTAAAATAAVGFTYWYLTRPSSSLDKVRKLPGPRGVPIFGNALTFLTSAPQLHKIYSSWTEEYGPTFVWWFGPYPVTVTSDLKVAKQIGERKFVNFMNHTPLPENMVHFLPGEMKVMKYGMDVARDEVWRGLRSTGNAIFRNHGLMASFIPVMQTVTDRLVRRLEGFAESGEAVEIWRCFGDMTLDVLGATVFGKSFNSIEGSSEAVEAARTIFTINVAAMDIHPLLALGLVLPTYLIPPIAWLTKVFPTRKMREVERAMGVLASLSDELYEDAVAELEGGVEQQSHNLLKMFIQARKRESGDLLTRDEVKAQAVLFLLAGYETTANTLAYAIYLISTNKESEKLLLEEIDAHPQQDLRDLSRSGKMVYLEGVIKEALRLFGPIPVTDRHAAEDMDIEGDMGINVPILKGQIVNIYTRGLSRSGKYWTDPDKFKPERFVPGSEIYHLQNHKAFMPWGLGPRQCVAADFALQEAKVALIALYRRFRFDHNPEHRFSLKFAASLAPKDGVEVFCVRRS